MRFFDLFNKGSFGEIVPLDEQKNVTKQNTFIEPDESDKEYNFKQYAMKTQPEPATRYVENESAQTRSFQRNDEFSKNYATHNDDMIFNERERAKDVLYRGAATPKPQKSCNLSGVKISKPNRFEDIQGLIDRLVTGNTVIVDLSELKESTAQRVLDMMSGAAYATGGAVEKLKGAMFVFSPCGVNILK